MQSGSNFVRTTNGEACRFYCHMHTLPHLCFVRQLTHARTHTHPQTHIRSISCLLRLVPRINGSNPEEEVKVCGGQWANIFRTSIQTSQSRPTWNEEFQWTLASAAEVNVCVIYTFAHSLGKISKGSLSVTFLQWIRLLQEAMLELSLWDTVNQQARYPSKFIGQVRQCGRS